MYPRSRFLIFLMLSVAFPFHYAHSRIINVPEEETTIQHGIDHAESGDTVLVQPGIYWERISFRHCRSVTVASLFLTTGDPIYIDSTIINSSNSYCVVFFNSDHQTCALIGFTITNGNGNRGGGIYINSPSPTTVSHVNIIDNEGIYGGGIYIGEESSPLIIDTKITGNKAQYGGGIYSEGAQPEIVRTSICDNYALSGGGGIYTDSDLLQLNQCTMVGNECGGTAQCILTGRRLNIENSILYFQENEEIIGSGQVMIINSDIEGGRDGIELENGEVEWNDSNIYENPLFVDPDNGNYYLTIDSPCIDGGNPYSARDPDGTRSDMGAFPYFQGGIVIGYILDAVDDEPIAGAIIRDNFNHETRSDNEGRYIHQIGTFDDFNLTVTSEGYNEYIEYDLQANQNETIEIDFHLTRPEFQLSEDRVDIALSENESTQIELAISNEGNGTLIWQVPGKISGESDFNSWELRRSITTYDQTGDGINGVLFIDNCFYISGDNFIYILDREGHLINRFYQPNCREFEMRDLAYDGENIWGAARTHIVGVTTEGDSVTSFEGPDESLNALAWDSDMGVFWTGGIRSQYIYAVDSEGNRIDQFSSCGLYIQGLAYYPDDPDGFNLYIFHGQSWVQLITKMETDYGDTLFVTRLRPEEGGSPCSAFITDQLDQHSWVFIDISGLNWEHRIDIWQMEKFISPLKLEPTEGEIEAHNQQNLSLTITTEDLTEGCIEEEIVFNHNCFGGETILPVNITVQSSDANIGDANIPDDYGICTIYPNPFNSTTTITYGLAEAAPARMMLYDLSGREVITLFDGYKQAGFHSVNLNSVDLSSGLYFLRLNASDQIFTQKVILIR